MLTTIDYARMRKLLAKDETFAARVWACRDNVGIRDLRYSLRDRRIVGIYWGPDQGVDCEAGPDGETWPWTTICELHGGICNHKTRADANSSASHPEDWCDGCAKNEPPVE